MEAGVTQQLIDFPAGFDEHLCHLGVDVGAMPARGLNPITMVEAPVRLNGLDTRGDPAIIGAFTYFGRNCRFQSAAIGRYCSVSDSLQVGLGHHPTDMLTTSPILWREAFNFSRHFEESQPGWKRALPTVPYHATGFTTIGNDVWIGCSVYLRDGITIGDGAIIGAHSVVTKDVPPYAIVGGSPARVIRYRFDDKTIERLLAVQWWNYNILELADLDMSDIDRALGTLEDALAKGLEPYQPAALNLVEEYGRYLTIQEYLRLKRA